LLGGYVATHWFGEDERGQMRASAVAVASIAPFLLAFLAFRQKQAALMALWLMTLVLNFFFAPTFALLQRLVRDEMRATTLAVVMLLANLIGMGVGPQVVGTLSDLLAPVLGVDSLRYAISAMAWVALYAAYQFWRAGLTVKGDLAAMNRHDAGETAGGLPLSASRLI
jgi:hypothetical protein